MTANAAPRRGTPPAGRAQPSLGQIAVGLLLIGGGIGWLLEVTGVATFDWGIILAGALVLVGGLLVIGARSRGHGGLIALGIILTLLLAVMSLANLHLEGGIGDRAERPTAVTEVQDRYALAIGDQTIDLTQVPFEPGVAKVEASIGMGTIRVTVPRDVGVQVRWTVGAGEATVLGFNESGVGLDRTYTSDDYATAAKKLDLELSAGLGTIEVQR